MSDITLRAILLGEDRSASKAVKGVGSAAEGASGKLGALSTRLGNLIGGDAGELLGKVSEGFDAAGEASGRSSKIMMGVGGVAAGAGLAMQKMASGDVRAAQQLEAAVKATGKGYDGFGEDVDRLISKHQKFGATDGEVSDSLRILTQSLDDPKKAVEQLGLAQDVAAAKGVDLRTAAGMVGKAAHGSGRLLSEMGIVVKKNKDGTLDYDGALKELAGKMNGQAAAAADTFGGKMAAIRAWTDNAASAIAEKYGPAVTAVGSVVTVAGTVLEIYRGRQVAATAADNLGTLAKARSVVGTVASTVATTAASVASKAWAAAQWLINAALSANPIGLVIVAIAALVAGIIYAYKNSETFRKIVDGAFRAIAAVATWFWNSVMAPVIRFLVRGFATVAEWIGQMLLALSHIPGFGWAKTAADKMFAAAGKAKQLADNIKAIPDKRVSVTVDYKIAGSVAARQAAKNKGAIPGIGMLASGGPADARKPYIVGEEGMELFIPSTNGYVVNATDTAAILAGGGGTNLDGGGGGSVATAPLTINLDGYGVWQGLLRVKRTRNGGLALGLG